jgi:hypothetical protein
MTLTTNPVTAADDPATKSTSGGGPSETSTATATTNNGRSLTSSVITELQQREKSATPVNEQHQAETVLNYEAAASNLLHLPTTPLVISSSSSASSSSSPPQFNQTTKQASQKPSTPLDQSLTTEAGNSESKNTTTPITPKSTSHSLSSSASQHRFVIKKVLDSELMSQSAAMSTLTNEASSSTATANAQADEDSGFSNNRGNQQQQQQRQLNESELANVSVVSSNLERKISKFTVKKVDTITILRTADNSESAAGNASIAEGGEKSQLDAVSLIASPVLTQKDVTKKVDFFIIIFF